MRGKTGRIADTARRGNPAGFDGEGPSRIVRPSSRWAGRKSRRAAQCWGNGAAALPETRRLRQNAGGGAMAQDFSTAKDCFFREAAGIRAGP